LALPRVQSEYLRRLEKAVGEQENSKQTPHHAGSMGPELEAVVKFIAVGSAAVIVIAVAYNFGLFSVVGISWMSKLSLQDHISTASQTFLLFLAPTVSALLSAHWGNEGRQEKKKPSKHPGRWLIILGGAGFVVPWLASIIGPSYGYPEVKSMYERWHPGIVFVAFLFWWIGMAHMLVARYENLFTPRSAVVLVIVPLSIAIAMLSGNGDGMAKMQRNDEILFIALSDGQILPNLSPIYTLHAGLLAYDPACPCVMYVPDAAVKRYWTEKKLR
jgi:hypothetical protein